METSIQSVEKFDTFVRVEKHIKSDNAADTENVEFEVELACHPHIGDGTGVDYWKKQGFIPKAEFAAQKKAADDLKAKLTAEITAELTAEMAEKKAKK